MKNNIARFLSIALVALMSVGLLMPISSTYAEDEAQDESTEESSVPGTNISLTPVSKVLQISSNSSYEDTLQVSNNGDSDMTIEVYAAPYSYVYSDEDDAYKLGFSNENSFTQLSRWITIKDQGGSFVEKATFKIAPNKTADITYKISTPDNIPAGGQYAVIFAHTLNSVTSANAIKTEASPGLVVYGRSTEGEAVVSAEISSMDIKQTITENETTKNVFNASAKVKNTGNVDFSATGVMKVSGILTGSKYETPPTSGRISVIPETELVVSDTWEETPSFGIFRVSWTVSVGEQTETIERIIFLIPPFLLVIIIMVLTILTIWIIIMVRKRKERRSRLAV